MSSTPYACVSSETSSDPKTRSTPGDVWLGQRYASMGSTPVVRTEAALMARSTTSMAGWLDSDPNLVKVCPSSINTATGSFARTMVVYMGRDTHFSPCLLAVTVPKTSSIVDRPAASSCAASIVSKEPATQSMQVSSSSTSSPTTGSTFFIFMMCSCSSSRCSSSNRFSAALALSESANSSPRSAREMRRSSSRVSSCASLRNLYASASPHESRLKPLGLFLRISLKALTRASEAAPSCTSPLAAMCLATVMRSPT
mmetsp:Transcript_13968/g.35206  ORF Transcript_13968/g.35206 Transcript_13968/m.35206 type:complete len:256 (-) Transcript_13968:642-1409(-)